MNKALAGMLLAAIITSSFLLIGCGPKGDTQIVSADPAAVSDPNGKAKALLDEFFALPEAEREDWARSKGFAFSVFESATDPQLKAQYDQYIRPLLGS